MIQDKIVFSATDRGLKERLLRKENLSLSKTDDSCKSLVITKKKRINLGIKMTLMVSHSQAQV